MRHLWLPQPGRVTDPRSRRFMRWPRLIVLAFSVLLVLAIAPPVQAASRDKAPHQLTPAQIQAIHQQLKKQIKVKHTGKAVHPATTVASPQPLRQQDSSLPAYNNTGVSDANTRSSANFDTANRSYSAQALQDVGLRPPDLGGFDEIADWRELTVLDLEEHEIADAVVVIRRPGQAWSEAGIVVIEIVVQCVAQAIARQILPGLVQGVGENLGVDVTVEFVRAENGVAGSRL